MGGLEDWKAIERALQRVLDLQHAIADLHPLLGRLYPIAVASGGQFTVFDVRPAEGLLAHHYAYVLQAPTPMPVPEGVRAAFPLDCYGGRAACVVTRDVFDALEGYVTIFHEFVHCMQWETCEPRLRQTLGIARQAQAENDVMWELHYPFPYADPQFAEAYGALLEASQEGDVDDVDDDVVDAMWASRRRLRAALAPGDWEYMVWQEWKEGLARYLENRIRDRLGLLANHGGGAPPYDRVTFYEGGARLIAALGQDEPGLLHDLEALFYRLSRGTPPEAEG